MYNFIKLTVISKKHGFFILIPTAKRLCENRLSGSKGYENLCRTGLRKKKKSFNKPKKFFQAGVFKRKKRAEKNCKKNFKKYECKS